MLRKRRRRLCEVFGFINHNIFFLLNLIYELGSTFRHVSRRHVLPVLLAIRHHLRANRPPKYTQHQHCVMELQAHMRSGASEYEYGSCIWSSLLE